MPKEEDLRFLRTAVDSGVLDRALADEILAALEQVEKLGAASSAREIALGRGALTAEQVEKVLAASRSKSSGEAARGRSARRPAPAPPGPRRPRRQRKRSPLTPIFAATSIFVLAAGAWLVYICLAGGKARPAPSPTADAGARIGPGAPRPVGPGQDRDPNEEGLAALESVRRWAEAEGREPEAAARRYKSVVTRYPGTPAAAAAAREAARLESIVEAGRRRVFDQVCQAARRLAAGQKYAEAAALLDRFAEEQRDLATQVSEERGLILSGASQAEQGLRARAGDLESKGDLEGALRLYEQIVAFGVPQLAGRARHEMEGLQKKLAAAREEARQAAGEAYQVLRLRLAPLLARRDCAEARRLLSAARADRALQPVRGQVEADLGDLDAVERLWAAAEKGASGLRPKEMFSAGGIRGTFEGFSKGVITIRASGLDVSKSLKELSTGEILGLAAREMPQGTAATRLAVGLFLLAEGRPTEAAEAFAAAEGAGGDAKRWQALLERHAVEALEAEAEGQFAALGGLAAAGKWRELADALAACDHKCSKTSSFRRRRPEMARLALQARLATLGIADLFHGTCRPAGNGSRVELTYDFTQPDQLADWDFRGKRWAIDGGQLVLDGALALLRAPSTRDVQATLQVADQAGPPGEWALSLCETADAAPALAIVLPDKAGLPAVLKDCKRELARAPVAFRAGQPHKLSFALRGRRAALASDGHEVLSGVWEGERPPQVQFALSSRPARVIQVSGVRVAVTLPEDWVRDELEQLRARCRKEAELAQMPWRSLNDERLLKPWVAERGAWNVLGGVLSVNLDGSVMLRDEADAGEAGGLGARGFDDFEWRLKAKPLRPDSLVRLKFRVSPRGGFHALTLGARPEDCALTLHGPGAGRAPTLVAPFAASISWKPEEWAEVRILAVGSELRVEARRDGRGDVLLCLARDGADREAVGDVRQGTIAMEVLQGGAAFRDMALRALK